MLWPPSPPPVPEKWGMCKFEKCPCQLNWRKHKCLSSVATSLSAFSDCCLLRGYFPVFIIADICFVFSKLLHWLSFLARTRKQIFTETGFHSTFVGQFPSEWDARGLIVETERLQFCDKRYTCDNAIDKETWAITSMHSAIFIWPDSNVFGDTSGWSFP